jgi:hypothetical protein
MKKTVYYILLGIFITACGSPGNKEKLMITSSNASTNNQSIDTTQEVKKENTNNDLNNIASFLGGTTPKSVGDFSSAFNSSSWKAHQTTLNIAWEKAMKEKITPMREWSKSEIIGKKSETLFYPFSGADFLHVYSANQDYTTYYLFGLEPSGEIPKKENILNPVLTSNILSTIYKSVDENLSQSFFHTKYMAVEFSNPILKGTIPVFMFFMNRMGLELTSISPVTFNEKGEIISATDFSKGVRIGFLDNGKSKELFYFSGDISNKGMNGTPGLRNMLNQISKDASVMMKSASYLCHMTDFTIIRDLIIANAYSIMQDDTGVPFKFYEQSKWNIRHYGSYTSPIPLFATRFQPDLKLAVSGKEIPIRFKYGYNNPPNLMVSIRK